MRRILVGLDGWKGCLVVFFFVFFFCLSVKAMSQSGCTLKEVIVRLQEERKVNFVYDSSLRLDALYKGVSLDHLPLEEALQRLFGPTGITWEIKGEYVLLHAARYYTLSGYVALENGEPLVNATVMDMRSGAGTLTNAYGFYSLNLPAGKHDVCISFVGCDTVHRTLDLQQDVSFHVSLKQSLALEEVTVVADLNASQSTTQTGKLSFTPEMLHTEYALFSSPDLVKTLQAQTGVASGIELLSGLYVHGGNNDGNLFLLDGMPLYQVNHVGGLFSAFNVDVIKNVDFYKSGFPARYGGRLSSVTDVRTKDGNLSGIHGTFSIGMLDGRFSLEGPLVKNRTSFSVGMRRSWLDLFMLPAMHIMNRMENQASDVETTDQKFRYAFHDINAKLTHRFSEHHILSFSLYSGTDLLKSRVRQQYDFSRYNSYINHHRVDIDLHWGNVGAALNWRCRFSPKLFGDVALVYARNYSSHVYVGEDRYFMDQQEQEYYQERINHSAVDDCGLYASFDYRLHSNHFIRFGGSYLYHAFRPQQASSVDYAVEDAQENSMLRKDFSCFYGGNEVTLYAEDEIRLSDRWSVNVGGRYTLFHTKGKVFHSLNPRVAARYRVGERVSLKASYTEMSQFVRQLSNTYLNLPTDCWIPSTGPVRPMHSRQWVGGVYAELSTGVSFTAEGYYKTMDGLTEYKGGGRLTPPVSDWEKMVCQGKGKAYGAELSAAYCNRRVQIESGYTLSWSRRLFPDLYPDWYSNKFDNRHRFTVQCRYRFNKRVSVYGMWCYSTGNRITLPEHYVEKPVLPGVSQTKDKKEDGMNWVYGQPNNAGLPAYHRLDLGADFRRITKRGLERIWNISIYNAYCRMNALAVTVEELPDGGFTGKAFGVIPVIPSFSYTLKF